MWFVEMMFWVWVGCGVAVGLYHAFMGITTTIVETYFTLTGRK